MPSVEDRLRAYAERTVDSVAAVTADEVRGRRGRGTGPVVWVALAAAVLLVIGIAATVARPGGDTKLAADGARDYPLTLDGHLDWQLALVNREIRPSDEEYARRFTPDFVAAVPLEEFLTGVKQLRAQAPWRVLTEVERRGDSVLAVQIQAADGTQARLTFRRGAAGRVDASTILIAEACAAALPIGTTPVPPAIAGQWAWVRDLVMSDRPVTEAELRDHLAPSFLAAVPPDEFRRQTTILGQLGPLTERAFEGQPSAMILKEGLGTGTGEEARLELAVELPAPHRIVGMTVRTERPCEIEAG